MKNAIKKYLETACLTDTALREKCSDSKMDGCLQYIAEQAKSYVKKNFKIEGGFGGGNIDSDIVFQWARHYMIDGATADETDDEEVAEAVAVQQAMPEKPAEKKAKKPKLGDLEQLDLFAGAAV